MRISKISGVILAATVAVSFATASFAATTTHTTKNQVKCSGANSCKSKSACKTAGNSCKGKNACKGKGWINTSTSKICKNKGGTVAK